MLNSGGQFDDLRRQLRLRRAEKGLIHYRVVVEYGGETLVGRTEAVSDKPFSLQEFGEFFLSAWLLTEAVEYNFEGDLEGGLEFFVGDSKFYPEFDPLCREAVIRHYRENDLEDEPEE